ncbi:MAG: hypothetical protein MRY81_15810 [Donghicola eburneus]|nr:hypothetical protein [Donghicola eburneus]MBY8964300.1 hypothetical protein [Algiphilus acroporae]MCI5041136.1 hypothetical protein [Donghicola eburneus]
MSLKALAEKWRKIPPKQQPDNSTLTREQRSPEHVDEEVRHQAQADQSSMFGATGIPKQQANEAEPTATAERIGADGRAEPASLAGQEVDPSFDVTSDAGANQAGSNPSATLESI